MKSSHCLKSVLPHKAFHSALLILFVGALAPLPTHGADGTWTNETTTQSLWTGSVNWLSGTIASGAGSTATITVANTAASKTISLNSTTQTIGILNIGNPNGTGIYQLQTGAMIFDNNGASAQINIASGSGGIIFSSSLTNTINDSLLISQNSSSLFTNNATYTGGTGSDIKVIEHAGTGTGGVVLAGVIADGGTGTVSVRQNNANGTMTLRAANTYTGGTVVDAGTLALAGSANRLAATGAVTVNGGTFNLGNLSNTVGAVTVNGGTVTNGTLSGSSYAVTGGTIAAILGGTGSALTKSGASTTTLTGVNTYTGGTAINGGVLRVSSRDNFANRLLSFDGGTLEATANISGFTSANNTTLNSGGGTILVGEGLLVDWGTAIISGGGALTKTGTGTLVLASGAVGNSFTGGTIINQGVVSISRATGLGNATNSVILNGGALRSTATITNSRATTLGTSGGIFDTATATTNTWNGVVSGSGKLTKSGAGALILGGNSTYSGATDVNAGTLVINGTNSSATGLLTVNSGGTIGGSGTIGGNTFIKSGGTLAPGNSPGVLTILGDLTLEGTVVMELNGLDRGTGYDGIDVVGALTYGGTLTLNFGATFNVGDSFNLFDFGSRTNSFEFINLTGNYIGSLSRSGSTWTGTVSGQNFAFYEETGNLNVVPEPSTVSLLIIAGLGLAGHVLRRRRRA